jgi:hypothetical protein
MGYVIGMGGCIICGRPFSFNPHRVPSFIVHGKREPVCRICVERVNRWREEHGLPPFPPVLPEAYEPIEENEL